jgi:hypothetical protein
MISKYYQFYMEEMKNMGGKYAHIDFVPPMSVRKKAALGLKLRREASDSNKGGLSVKQAKEAGVGSGVQRAVNLKNGDKMSPKTIKRMYSFFSRHSVFVKNHSKNPPNRSYISHLIWGGDPGYTWCKKIYNMMKRADEKEN